MANPDIDEPATCFACMFADAQVRLDQTAAETCVARFRALQAEDAGLGWQDLNTFITVRGWGCKMCFGGWRV